MCQIPLWRHVPNVSSSIYRRFIANFQQFQSMRFGMSVLPLSCSCWTCCRQHAALGKSTVGYAFSLLSHSTDRSTWETGKICSFIFARHSKELDLLQVDAGTSEVKRSPTEPELSSKMKSSGSGSVSSAPKNVKDLQQSPVNSNVDIFTYEEMRLATKHFRPDLIIGEGGFGIVYKGVIDDRVRQGYRTTKVAIKELNPEGFQGDREWLAEVIYLGQLSHPNLVKLIGYCCEDEHRLLVYEYMAGGSLEKNLFRRVGCTLTWPRRIKIALGVAKGLAFLHGAERSIIYRDFKPSNILLDEDYSPKLSDFGLAKEGPIGDQTHVSTRVMGTYGYAAPEYIMTGHLTARSDVYGFGVVLLEMLIGRGAMEKHRPSREHNLVEWTRPLLNNNKKLPRILDPRIEGQYSVRTAMKVANLAYQCLSPNPKGRPVMSEVVETLESLYGKEISPEEAMLESGCGSITLFEAAPNDDSPERKETRR